MTGLRFDGRVAIDTGAGEGLGRSHALDLAARGAQVVVNDVGGAPDGSGATTGPAQAVVDEIIALGGEAVTNHATVATAEGGAAVVASAIEAFGRIDIVVNNAGILRDATFRNLTEEELDLILDVHVRGALHVTRPAWQAMREQGYGRIVNTSSSAGIFGNFGQASYAIAKMELIGLTRVLAIEGHKNNIKVNAIAPMARTRMTETMLGDLARDLGPELVTPVVSFLAHEECDVSGGIYAVGGGRIAQVFLGQTTGFVDRCLTAECVRDHLEAIRDQTGYAVPSGVPDELRIAIAAIKSAQRKLQARTLPRGRFWAE